METVTGVVQRWRWQRHGDSDMNKEGSMEGWHGRVARGPRGGMDDGDGTDKGDGQGGGR